MKIVALALLAGLVLQAQVPQFLDPERKQKIVAASGQLDALFERYYRERKVPGLVYGLVVDGELAHVKAWGVQRIDTKAAVTPDSMFRIASMTKSFTELAILKLRDAGKLSLDEPASKYVPELAGMKYPTRDSAPITVRQLLTHSAGFPEDNPWGDRQLAIPDAEMGKWVDRGIPFSTTPGTAYEYSNYGFALLGRIVTKVAGVPYDKYLEREILAPLGMKASTLDPSRVPAGVHSAGYGLRDEQYFEIPSLGHGSFGAMGGLVTSARDLARYVAFQLSAEPSRDDAEAGPVRRSSVREMQQAWRASGLNATRTGAELRASSTAYGYGLSVTRDCRLGKIVAHGGGLPGFGSYMMWLPEYGVGMFAMANLTYAGPSGPMREGFELLEKKGILQARKLPPSPYLKATQARLTELFLNWKDARMDEIAADNLYLDQPRERFAKQVAELNRTFKGCKPDGEVDAENWLRGTFRLSCDAGSVSIGFTLAPTQPPLVQYLRFSGVVKPSAALAAAATAQAEKSPFGACQLGAVLASDGASGASYHVSCSGEPALMSLQLKDGEARATFGRAPGEACTP